MVKLKDGWVMLCMGITIDTYNVYFYIASSTIYCYLNALLEANQENFFIFENKTM